MNLEREEVKILSLLSKICRELYTSHNLEKALDTLANATIETLKVKGCSVKILNERHTKLEIYSIKGMSDTFLKDVGIYGMFRSAINQEAIKGEPIFIEDLEKETRVEVPQELKKEGIRAIASLPIKLEERVIGVLSVYHDKPFKFEEDVKIFLNMIATQGAAVISSLRHFQRMETLIDIGKTINSSLDLDFVLNEIVVQAARTTQCKAASIRLLDESTNRVVFKTSYGLSKDYIKKIPRTLDESPIDREVLEKKEVLYIEDLTKDPRVRIREDAKIEGLASMLCVPLVFQDKAIGILKIYTATPTKFSTDEINFLKSLGELSAIAVRNASFYEKLHSLYQVTSSLSSTLEVDRILELLCMHAADYLNAMGAQVLVWDKDQERFSTRVAYHLGKKFVDSLLLDKKSWSAQETLAGNTIIISDILEDERLDIKEAALKSGIRSMVSVPLKTMDRITGILQIYCKNPRNFTSDEIEFLTTLANHGAIALENAKVHEHFKSEYEKLINDIYVWHDWTSYVIRE